MTIKQMTIGLLSLMILAGLLLAKCSEDRYSFYKQLMKEVDRITLELDQLESIEVSEDVLEEMSLTRGKVIVLSLDGHRKEIRYYDNGNCITIDYLGEGEELVRRDMLSEGFVRVRLLYDAYKSRLYRQFLDKDGNIIDIEPYYVPFGAGRATY